MHEKVPNRGRRAPGPAVPCGMRDELANAGHLRPRPGRGRRSCRPKRRPCHRSVPPSTFSNPILSSLSSTRKTLWEASCEMPAKSRRLLRTLRSLNRTLKRVKPERFERVVHPAEDLRSAASDADPDRIEIELDELAEASRIGFVGPPDRCHLVAAEREREVGVLRDDAGKRRRSGRSGERHPPLPGFDDRKDLLGVLLPVAEEGDTVLLSRRLERHETRSVHRPSEWWR